MSYITLGGGCFWCLEAVYQQIIGIKTVVSGYAGGTTPNPRYDAIGDHAEVIQIEYDPSSIALDKLLEIFFYIHDPTSIDRQGNDVGRQYRSIILVHSEDERAVAESAKSHAQLEWDNPIVTEISVLQYFYEAERYHQNYYGENSDQAYCQVVIRPKLEKFSQKFSDVIRQV